MKREMAENAVEGRFPCTWQPQDGVYGTQISVCGEDNMIRAMIVDELPLFRIGMRTTLERRGDCRVVGEATHLRDVLAIAQTHVPDLALVASDLTVMNALDIVHLLRQQYPSIGILVLAESPNEEQMFQFIRMGASAYEAKTITPEALVDKSYRVSHGEYLLSDEVLHPLSGKKHTPAQLVPSADAQQDKAPGTPSPLSSRELEILKCIAEGNSNKAIARILNISDQTVKNHITSTLKKLAVDDRTAAVVTALCHRWLRLESLVEQQGEQDRHTIPQQHAPFPSGKQKQYTLLGV